MKNIEDEKLEQLFSKLSVKIVLLENFVRATDEYVKHTELFRNRETSLEKFSSVAKSWKQAREKVGIVP